MMLHAQLSLDWAISQGSKVSDFPGTLQQDDQGHLYSFVLIPDTADLDPGMGENILIPSYDRAGVLSRWTTTGEYLWSSTFECPTVISGGLMQVKDNQMLLYFQYTDSLVYTHTGFQTILSVHAGNHLCVVRLDLNGNVDYFKDIHEGTNMYISYLKANDDGLIVAGGGFEDNITLQSETGVITASSNGLYDAYIAYFTPDFNALRLQTLGGKGSDYIENLHVADERAYFAIVYDDTLIINHGQQTETFPANGKENGLFGYVKADNNDIVAYSFGGDLSDELRSIAADAAGNIYVCGSFEGTVNFEHPDAPPVTFTSINGPDGFVSKYYPDGHLAWTRIFKDSKYGGLHHLQLHRDNQLYLAGGYNGHTDLDPGADSIIVETTNWGDIYTVKFDTDGDMKWVYSFSGPDLEGISELTISPEGRVFLMGFHYDTFDADPSDQVLQVPNLGGTDMFIIGLTEENVITATDDVAQLTMLVYPNPASEYVEIRTDSPIESVDLSNMQGVHIMRSKGNNGNTMHVDIHDLISGMYTLRIKSADQYTTRKFLKVN